MKTKAQTYSFLKGVLKFIISAVILWGPSAISLIPSDIGNLTISAVLFLGINYLKVTYK
jgi:hypothetical protein